MSARPLNLGDTKAAAIMDIWYPGSEGGNAIANLLFGDAVPGGKLPLTWIGDAAHAPMPYAHLLSHDPRHANQRYWNGSSETTYPFGYGLRYTSFAYSDLRIERAQIKPGEPVTMSVELKKRQEEHTTEVHSLMHHTVDVLR